MVERKLAGAHYGLRDWAMQRVTAVIMLIYTVLFVLFLLMLPSGYDAWQAFFCANLGEAVYPSYFCGAVSACMGRHPRFVDGLCEIIRLTPVSACGDHYLVGRLLGLFG